MIAPRTRCLADGVAADDNSRPPTTTDDETNVNQLRCRDLRPGDLLLKLNAGSAINKLIAQSQQMRGQLNPQIVHAAVMFDNTFVVEASGGGIHASDMRVQNKGFGYIVYRARNEAVARGAGEYAKIIFDIQSRNHNLSYAVGGAVGSLFPKKAGGPKAPGEMDKALDRMLEGKSHPFFCSQFAVHVFQFAAEQNGIPAANMFPMRDGKVSPSTLASMLQSNGSFSEAGYLMPNER